MPQMNPMNWLILLVFFSFLYYLTMIKLYYFFKLKKMNSLGSSMQLSSSMGLKI